MVQSPIATAWEPGLGRRTAGLNLCHENAEALLNEQPRLDFIQVHPEHLLQEKGGQYRHQLDQLRQIYAVTFHGFGLSVGSIAPLNRQYLQLVRDLLRQHPESFFSDHVSWSSLSQHHFHDLIPIVYSEQTLQFLCERVEQIQDAIEAPLLLENISSYMRFGRSTMDEIDFINALTARTGCYLLLDLNNLYANAMNFGDDPALLLERIRPDSVRSYHMAGCTEEQHERGTVWIDYHREPVRPEVWSLYQKALELFGPWSTLLEWENNIPPLQETLAEVRKIERIMAGEFPASCQVGA